MTSQDAEELFLAAGYGIAQAYEDGKPEIAGRWYDALSAAQAVPIAMASTVAELTDEQRVALFASYCTHCGAPDPECQCWNDD